MSIGKNDSATLGRDEFWVNFNVSGEKSDVAMHDKNNFGSRMEAECLKAVSIPNVSSFKNIAGCPET